MNGAGKLIGQGIKDQALTGHPRLPLERRRHHHNIKMGLAPLAPAAMTPVTLGIIHDIQTRRVERVGQFFQNRISNTHAEFP